MVSTFQPSDHVEIGCLTFNGFASCFCVWESYFLQHFFLQFCIFAPFLSVFFVSCQQNRNYNFLKRQKLDWCLTCLGRNQSYHKTLEIILWINTIIFFYYLTDNTTLSNKYGIKLIPTIFIKIKFLSKWKLMRQFTFIKFNPKWRKNYIQSCLRGRGKEIERGRYTICMYISYTYLQNVIWCGLKLYLAETAAIIVARSSKMREKERYVYFRLTRIGCCVYTAFVTIGNGSTSNNIIIHNANIEKR